MGWTYTGNDRLARAATRLYALRPQPCNISPLVFMSDPERTPDVLAVAEGLPQRATLIYRHFGAQDKLQIAIALRQICFERRLQFLIGQDVELAAQVGADGVHLPERDLGRGKALRARYPDWLLTGAAHCREALMFCSENGLDAALVSPIFTSASKSAGAPIGAAKLAGFVETTQIPIIALGGINANTAGQLIDSGAAGIAGVSMFVSGHDT